MKRNTAQMKKALILLKIHIKKYLLLKKFKFFFLYCCVLFHRIIRNVNLSTLLSFSSPSNEREEEKKQFVPIVLIYIFIGAVCVLADCWVFGQQSHSCLERRGGRPITLTILSSIQSKVAKEDIFTFSDYFFKTSAWLVAHIDKVGLKKYKELYTRWVWVSDNLTSGTSFTCTKVAKSYCWDTDCYLIYSFATKIS